jgi:hypothetical protein
MNSRVHNILMPLLILIPRFYSQGSIKLDGDEKALTAECDTTQIAEQAAPPAIS